MLSVFFTMLIGKFGLGLVISGAMLAAWWFIPEVPWLTDKLRKALLFGGVIVGACTLSYGYGGVETVQKYQAKLTTAINKSIQDGDRARTEALKKFDAQKDSIDDDGFARD
jgi:hypothetical protein